jgi:hypothetical protein
MSRVPIEHTRKSFIFSSQPVLCLAKIPSGCKMSLTDQFSGRFDCGFWSGRSRSVTEEINENRTKYSMRGW